MGRTKERLSSPRKVLLGNAAMIAMLREDPTLSKVQVRRALSHTYMRLKKNGDKDFAAARRKARK